MSCSEADDVLDSLIVRDALLGDVAAICGFGAAHIPAHYGPLIGQAAARAQVERWWNPERVSRAVEAGQVAIAEAGDEVIGVAERGEWEGQPVVWKLYVHPDHRGNGIGPKLLQALIEQLPAGTDRLQVEHFEVNRRAGAFYEREGFVHIRTESNPAEPVMAVVWRELDLHKIPRRSSGLVTARPPKGG